MVKEITCIDCPKGCKLIVETDGKYVIKLSGNECDKGEAYAKQEIENPERILATTVLAQGLDIKMIPVRTNKPIPKDKIFAVMGVVRGIRVRKPVRVGDIVLENVLGLGADVVATRDACGV
ncbi:MAG: DUF1667 domain-containing protein [bacterium]